MAEEQFQEDDFDIPADEDFLEEEPKEAPMPAPRQSSRFTPTRILPPKVPSRRQMPMPMQAQPEMQVQAQAPQVQQQQQVHMPQQQMQQQVQPQAPQAEVAQARYVPYEMPKRIGVLDRTTGKPIIEDEDMIRVVMAQLADIKNDIEEIKSYYR